MTDAMANEQNAPIAALLKYSDSAHWAALRITKSAALADEAVQDAYVGLLCRPPLNYGEERMRNLFLKAVRRYAFKLMTKERNIGKREEVARKIAANASAAAKQTKVVEALAPAARLALESLPLAEREAVSLCCEQGLTHQMAAEVLGVSKQTVGYRVNRGLEKLRKILTTQGFAATTPGAIGAALGAIPLPPITETLRTALGKFTADPSLLTTEASAALSATFGKKLTGFLLWPALLSVLGLGGLWWLSNARVADDFGKTVASVREETSAETSSVPSERAKFHRVWTFENGVPPELELTQGSWEWLPAEQGHPPGMHCNNSPIFHLKQKLPDVPLLFSVVISFRKLKKDDVYYGSFWLSDGERLLPHTLWKNPVRPSGVEKGEKKTISTYILERRKTALSETGSIASHVAYKTDLAEKSFVLLFEAVILEKLEIRELSPEEIPEKIRDPEALIVELEKQAYLRCEEPGLAPVGGKLKVFK
jgi:RNA polymerase sigma-70 factor (ECF subfamily)